MDLKDYDFILSNKGEKYKIDDLSLSIKAVLEKLIPLHLAT